MAPSTCPIDLFGPLANRTILKHLRYISGLLASVLHAARSVLGTAKVRLQHSLPEQFAGAARVFHALGSVILIRKPRRIRAVASKPNSSAARVLYASGATAAQQHRTPPRSDACPCTSTTAPVRRARRKKWRITRTPSRRTSTSASATTVASGVLAFDESRRWRGGA